MISSVELLYLKNRKYFNRNIDNNNDNSEESDQNRVSREDQLKLMEGRAKDNHITEQKKGGLVVVEGYYGDKNIIEIL